MNKKEPKTDGTRNRYQAIIEEIFFNHYESGMNVFEFDREEIEAAARTLAIKLPKNLGDVIYSFRYRSDLPDRILETCPAGKTWLIPGGGPGKYRFELTDEINIIPNSNLGRIKIPDATPGLISKYALSDEQALLARLRYNRLIDIFTQVACYSLQNHLRTSVAGVGQVETDEIYVGVSKSGSHYVFPVQAKGGSDKLSIVQIQQDLAMCEKKFSSLICRPIATQFMDLDTIAIFEIGDTDDGLRIIQESHYVLVSPGEVKESDLRNYRKLINGE